MGLSLNRRHIIASALLLTLAQIFGAKATPLNSHPPATLLVLGDSLSAEYGLPRGTGWVALLQARLASQKPNATVINASISGDTTSGGASRLPALLEKHRPTHVIIELGGNDALRGMSLQGTQSNLSQMTEAAKKFGAKVLLLGMQVPPNYGQDYANRFAALFSATAKNHKTALVPFLLKGVADAPQARELFQADRIHPAEPAQAIMLDNVWPELKKLLP
jgi:acyl-CoA thioesterase I